MYTQIQYADLVDRILTRVGQEHKITFERPSIGAMHSYETGKWLYEIHGISVEVFRWATRDPQKKDLIPGYKWNDEQNAFEQRLEADIRAKIGELMRKESGKPASLPLN